MTPRAASASSHGLPEAAVIKILALLGEYPEIESAILFGSRAKGNFRIGSDIDLCILAPNLSMRDRLQLENRLDDLLLPWNVDLVLWHEIENPALRDHIERCGISFVPVRFEA
jgi:predicted nucleotidyltransferase